MKKLKKLLKMSLPLLLAFFIVFSPAATSTSLADSPSANTRDLAAQSGDYIYYSVYNKIYRVNTATKAKKLIHTRKSGGKFYDLVVYKGYIYCVLDTCDGTGEFYPYIYRVKTNGTNAKIIEKGEYPYVYQDKIYYSRLSFVDGDFDSIKYLGLYKMTLSGNSKTKLSSVIPLDINVYKSYVYYTGNAGTYRRKIDGSNYRKLSSNTFEIFDIYKDNIYYNSYDYDYNNYDVYKYSINSKRNSLFVPSTEGFAVENGYLYSTNTYYDLNYPGETYIKRTGLSSKSEYLIARKKNVYSITLKDDYFFYLSEGSSLSKNTRASIMRKDGRYNTTLIEYYLS